MAKKWRANSITFRILKVLGMLPSSIRYPIIRKFVDLSYELPADYVFKLAETQDEIEQALTILHNGFVERNLIDAQSSHMRITKYHCLPTTAILILKVGDEVAGTITAILDSKFGLPTDEYRDLSIFRDKNQRIVEISGLAIKPKFRGSKGKILMPLCKFLWTYASDFLKADIMIISTKVEARDIYRAVLLFEGLEDDKIVRVNSLKGSATCSQWVAVNSHEKFEKIYGKNKKSKNVYFYFTGHTFKNMILPQNPYYNAYHSVLTPEVMLNLFQKKSSIFKNLTEKEKQYLHKTFFFPEFKEIIGEVSLPRATRSEVRIQTYFKSTLVAKDKFYQCIVDDASIGGLRLSGDLSNLKLGERVTIRIQLGPSISTKLTAQVMWVFEGKFAGLKLESSSDEWLKFMDYAQGKFSTSRAG
jgi:hypothetical protein